MENSFKSVIEQSKSVLILLPKGPFFDQVAAGLSLYLALEGTKDVAVSCPSPMVVEHNRLVGVNRVTEELGNKNLVLRFTDYDPENIERVSYDIEDKQFRLSVIPKPQVAPPNKDQVQVTYSGISADTVVLVGGLNESHFPALSSRELTQARVVHIGFQDLQLGEEKKIISLAKPSSSVSELMANYIKQLETKLTPDIASNLLAGVTEGSKNFTSSHVTADTFKLVAELMEAGGDHTPREDTRPSRPPRPRPRKTEEKPEQPREEKAEAPQENDGQSSDSDENAPKSWLEPKIYKSTNSG